MNQSAKNLSEVLGSHTHKEEGVLYLSLERMLTEEERLALINRMQSGPHDAHNAAGRASERNSGGRRIKQ